MKLPIIHGLLLILSATAGARADEPKRPAPTVSLGSLLDEMTDRDALARWPLTRYTSKQASSYDRTQTDPADAKTWFANKDYEQFLRVENNGSRKEWVIMEHDGPGCVTRIWAPLFEQRKNQVVRFYLDGASKPAIEAKLNELVSGQAFVHPPLAFIAWDTNDLSSQHGYAVGAPHDVGGDFYLPIPFAKSCKITLDELPFYYCVNYRAYETGTKIETFSVVNFEKLKDKGAEVSEALFKPYPRTEVNSPRQPAINGGAASPDGLITLSSGEQHSTELSSGPAALDGIALSLDTKLSAEALRSTILQIEFDGQTTVWCPIGEFFGCGVTLQPVEDWNRTVTRDGHMASRWVMPYQKSARVTIKNCGTQPIRLMYGGKSRKWEWDDRSMYFHADWRYEHPIATRPMSDWNYVTIDGPSVLVGDTLTAFSPSAAWYGEGDERIYVDGEKFPSHLGTGTEDYYGYAWGMANYFSSPFMSMPKREIADRNDWRGHTTTSRLRMLDRIPAERSLKFDMEIWHWADCKVGYSAATFWYGRPGAKSNIKPAPEQAAAALPSTIHRIAGAIECETMQVVRHSPDLKIETQRGAMTDGAWSGDAQLFVRATKPGDSVDLLVADGVSGPQRVKLYATKSYDYGTLRFESGGKTLQKSWDGWSEKPVAVGPLDLGVVEPENGRVVLHVEVTGTNPKSTGPKYYLGLDAVTLTPP